MHKPAVVAAVAEDTVVAAAEATWAAFGGGMGGFGGGHIGGFGGGRIGGLGGGHLGGIGAGRMAHVDHDHLGAGRRRFVGGFYDYGLDCPYNPYYTPSNWPYTCTY